MPFSNDLFKAAWIEDFFGYLEQTENTTLTYTILKLLALFGTN